ncbi:AAA family ATPase [Legionella sp. km772]|uniref:AAA family ATPase n=1 Tax=Legionella sp. km772 TaxID=2498111 RepID=UPI000F8EEC75|nr:AAA family ATPase [Legionella sp. km772]RUR12666.1 hypothetical protein ELY15_04345 [Legionella sp. km772]
MKDGQIHVDLGTANRVRSLFKPGTWLTKIDFINHLVLFNNVLITVLSEKAGGKTSFSALLLNNLDQQIKPVFINAQVPCDRGDILGDIAAQLHLNLDANTNVNSIVAQINDRKAHVLLVIDDAQHLPEDLIRDFLIAIRNQDDFGFFHLCMVSDYSVVATLNNLAADEFSNLVHTIELGSLNENETRTYVLQRAMTARLINKPLTESQFKQFYQQTKGNIAKINNNLESFIFKCTTAPENNSSQLVKRVAMAAGLALVAGISYLYIPKLSNPQHTEAITLNTSLPPISQAVNETVAAVVIPEIQLVSYIPSFRESAVIQLVENALPKKQILDLSEEELNSNTVALVDKVIVIPTVRKQEIGKEIAKDAVRTSLATVAHEKQKQATLAVARPVQRVVKKSAVNQVARSSGFTIQLIASHRKSDLDRFKRNNRIYAATRIRHFSNQKGSWYILTMGEFNTRAEAVKKANNLPASLAKLNPWVRPVSGLKNIA